VLIVKPLRWVALLPGALVAGYAAYLVGGTINNLSITLYMGRPPNGWTKLLGDFMAHMFLGAAFVYAGAFIAPTQKPIVAMALGALSIFLGGAFVWASLIVEKYRAIIAIAGLLFGSSVTAFSIMTGEVSAGAVDE